MLDYLKGLYQDVEAKLPQVFCDSFYKYTKENALEIAKDKVKNRVFNNVTDINFILFIPVVNWEAAIIERFSKMGVCHHCNIESTGFFKSKIEWEKYKLLNTKNIHDFFDKNYDESKLNIVFMYLSEFHFDITTVEKLRKKNTIIINFNWDDILHYKRSHKGQSAGISALAKVVDFNLTMSISSLTQYVRDNAAVFHWDGLDSINNKQPEIIKPKINRVLFYGARYGYRGPLIEYLIKRGVPIDVYGKGWDTDFIEYDELLEKIPSYSLNLGISTIAYSRRLCCFKGRDLEVPYNKGLYLVNDHKEITNVYKANKEVLVYRSKSDCYEKINAVLANPDNYLNIKAAGAAKAETLSWDSRIRYLLMLVNMIVGRE